MHFFISAIGALFILFHASNAQAVLYPQRVDAQPVVRATEGYNIHAGRDYTPPPRPMQQAAPIAAQPPAQDWIEIDTPPSAVQISPALTPAPAASASPKTIENQGLVKTLGGAVSGLNDEVNYKGNFDAGLQYSTGNTKLQDFNLNAELIRESAGWTNRLRGIAALTEANEEVTEEEYRAELESQYNISKVDFLFGEAEYIDDRFSGYDFRITEVLGYGRKWVNSATLKWSSQVGAGFQHYKEEEADREDVPLGRLQNDFEWDITDKLGVENHVQVDISDLTAIRTETALKNQLIGSLFLKLAVVTNYLSEVPDNREELDVDTMVNLSYEFD